MHRKLVAITVIAVLWSGCGFLEADLGNFPLRIPEKEFTVDSAQWELTDDSTFPAVDCMGMPGVCSAAIMQLCGNDALCFGSCDGANCAALALIQLSETVDLASEAGELQSVDGAPLVGVTVNSVEYDVVENTFNIPTPEVTFYAAPAGVTNFGDPTAKAVGTVAPLNAAQTVMNQQMNISPQGREDLRLFMKDYKVPFNIIFGAQVNISAGDPVPAGRLTARVRVDATASADTGCQSSRGGAGALAWLAIGITFVFARRRRPRS